jgi:hypothetical protein
MSSESNVANKDGETNQKDVSEDNDVVNPWEVKAESMTGVDYDKIIGELQNDPTRNRVFS